MKEQELIFLREFQVSYWFGYPHTKKPSTKGFPKTEAGEKGKSYGAAGALRVINSGWAAKVQCIHRPTGKVLWTAVRRKVPGLTNIYAADLIKGDFEFDVKGKK